MIAHVAFEASEADREPLAAFFELLGYVRVEPPPSLRGVIWLERDESQLHILPSGDDAVAPPRGHVAIVCADYDATVMRLRDAGFSPEPRREHWGAPRSFVRAPGGHRVELTARAPTPRRR